MSDIAYFKQFVEKYPSFGTICSPNDGKSLAEVIKRSLNKDKISRYNIQDINKYEKEHDITNLINFMMFHKS